MFLVFMGVMYVAALLYLLIAYRADKPPAQPAQPQVLERRMF